MAKEKKSGIKIEHKEKISEETTEQKKANQTKKLEKQSWIFAGIAFGIILVIFCIFFYMQSLNQFKYSGLEFKKTMIGQITLYRTNIPIIENKVITEYVTVDFRNSPKDIANIEVNTIRGINLITNNLTYISYNKSLKVCEDNGLAAANLGVFLSDMGINKKGAIDDIDYINNTNLPYVNCETNPHNSVIYITNGDETRIEQTSANCYRIIAKDCDILKATERFELAAIEQYMETL